MSLLNERLDRLSLFQLYIDEYSKSMIDADIEHNIIIEDVSELNNIYWKLIESKVRPEMVDSDGRINHYKIIAGFEYAIMKVLPYKLPLCENEPRKSGLLKINADFAIYCSLRLLRSFPLKDWNKEEKTNFARFFRGSIEKIQTYLEGDHTVWLCNLSKEKEEDSVFICSQFWKMVSLYIEQEAGIKHRF